MSRRRQFTREQYVEAARRIAVERGASRLTLDAVGKLLGASRGAITHNFHAKRDLVAAMVEEAAQVTTRIVDEEIEANAQHPNPVLAGTIGAIRHRMAELRAAWHGVAEAANAEDPPMLDVYRRMCVEFWDRLRPTLQDPVAGLVVWMATEGMIALEMVDAQTYSPEQRDLLLQRLLTLAETA